jgi:hypothetical protein
MKINGSISGLYCGYRTPFHDEGCSERVFFSSLRKPTASLLPIGRQMKVFGVEKLDLLALDAWAQPWIFEFKRDVADYKSIGQLLTYGSYVVRWTKAELESKYRGNDRRKDLGRAFRDRFDQILPRQLSNRVNLVIAAHDFSPACRHTLQFLHESCQLVIGKLKIDCVWDWKGGTQFEHRWLQFPTPTNNCGDPVNPTAHFVLSEHMNNLPIEWNDCIFNRLLPIPKGWKSEIPEHSGVFVHLTDPPHSGLVGYGIAMGEARDLRRDVLGVRWTEKTKRRLEAANGARWFLPIRWIQKREAGNFVPIAEETRPVPGLEKIEDQARVRRFKEKLGVEDAICTVKSLGF